MEDYSDITKHPKYTEAIVWCPGNEEQVMMAIQVYLDLCEVRGWHEVKTHHCKKMNTVFLSGRQTKETQTEIILPTDIYSQLSPADMKVYFEIMKLENVTTNSIILAVFNIDSTIVFYKLFEGLVPPDTPEISDQKRRDKFESFERSKSDLPKFIDQYHEDRQYNNSQEL